MWFGADMEVMTFCVQNRPQYDRGSPLYFPSNVVSMQKAVCNVQYAAMTAGDDLFAGIGGNSGPENLKHRFACI